MTKKFHLTVKNYRCFDDANPLRITIQDGFVALVGPNNSGKSSFLRLFYEFRHVWENLSHHVRPFIALNSPKHTVNYPYLGVFDQDEIFNDANGRELKLEFVIDNDSIHDMDISKIEFLCNRKQWRAEFHYGKNYEKMLYSVLRETGSHNDKLSHGSNRDKLFNFSHFMSLFKDLSSSIYIGPFRNAISEGSTSYFDLLIGTQFIDQWNNWKTGPRKIDNVFIEKVTDDIKNVFEFNNLEINASPELKTLQFIVNNKPYKLKELGAGISQFVIVLGNVAIKKPAYLFIDEPELNLHPSLQLDFLTTLASYVKKSVVYATHSIGLARSSADVIYSFNKKNGVVVVKPIEDGANYNEFMGEMSFSTYKEMGFDSILCVEGVKDVKTVQQFLRKLKKDHKVVILPLGGDQMAVADREMELEELKRLSDKIYVLVDSERVGAGQEMPSRRKDFISTCEKLGFKYCATNYRAIENYFTDEAVKSVMGQEYGSLSPYAKLSECQKPWGKTDNWKIARAMSLSDIENTDVGKFLSSI